MVRTRIWVSGLVIGVAAGVALYFSIGLLGALGVFLALWSNNIDRAVASGKYD